MAFNPKKSQSISHSTGYDQFPYDKFQDAGFEWVPIVNWLRLCPFNETTKRWHVPMRDSRTNAVYWTVYKWFRSHQWDYQHQINRAMGESRGLFSDDAQEENFSDFWLVADYDRRIDLSLFGDPEKIDVKVAPNIRAIPKPEDLMIPNQKGEWVYSTKITKADKGMDAELRKALDDAYAALKAAEDKTKYMKTGNPKYFNK